MAEKPEETNSYFKTFNTQSDENLQGKEGRVKATREKSLLIASSPSIPENYSIDNNKKHFYGTKSNNMANTIAVIDDKLTLRKELNVMRQNEKPNIFVQENSDYYVWPWQEQKSKVYKLPQAQLSDCVTRIWTNRRQSENSSPDLKGSRHSYAEVLKSNITSQSTPRLEMEVDNLKNILKNDSILDNKKVNCLKDGYENPFGVIGANVVEKNELKTFSELQMNFSCYLNEKNRFLGDSFPHTLLKINLPDYTELFNYLDKETKGLPSLEKYFWNKLSDEDELWQKYSLETDLLNVIEFDDYAKETDREFSGYIPKLSDTRKINTDQYINSPNALLDIFNFRYLLKSNWYGVSRDSACIETPEKDIFNFDKDDRPDSSGEHNSYTSLHEVIPIEHVLVPSSSPVFLSNTSNIRRNYFKSKPSVLYIPQDRCLDQDADSQETDFITSPTYIAIESELSQLWEDKSQTFLNNNSKNDSHLEGQGTRNEDGQNDQQMMDDLKFCDEMQLSLNSSTDVMASSISNSSTLITSSSPSILLTEKEYNNTDVANHQSNPISDACVHTIKDRLSVTPNNTASILKEASNILRDFDSSYDFYKSVRNEVHQEIEKIDQSISVLSEVLNL